MIGDPVNPAPLPNPYSYDSMANLGELAPVRGRGATRTPPPEESAILVVFRDEMRKLLEKPLTLDAARKLGRMVEASIHTIKATATGVEAHLSPPRKLNGFGMAEWPGSMNYTSAPSIQFGNPGSSGPDQVDLGISEPTTAFSPPVETMGNSAMRELANAAGRWLSEKEKAKSTPLVLPAFGRSPTELVHAIAEAKKAGLGPRVMSKLEKALDDALEGEKPAPGLVPAIHSVPSIPAEEPAMVRVCPADAVGIDPVQPDASVQGVNDPF